MTELARSSRLQGTVTDFDDAVGLGTLTAASGIEYPFHCIELADGTRTIEVGADVTFVPLPKLGRYEASDISNTSRTQG